MRILFTVLCHVIILAPLVAQDFYPRMKEPGVFWYGANHVFVGQDSFIQYADRNHPPEWQREYNSGSATVGYDFRDVTCNASTDTFSARNFQLPNGAAVQFKYDTTLPTPLKGWKNARNTWYYIINSTPAAQYTGQGTFKLSATPGGSAIDITDTGSTCSTPQQMSFAGWKSQITLDVPQVYRVILDPVTDEFQTLDKNGNPVAHNLPSSGSGHGAFFTTTGTYPTGLHAFASGDRDKRCVVPTSDPTKFKTRTQSIAQACPSTYMPPNDTFTAMCGVSGDATAACTTTGGFSLPASYMRVRVISVQSGTLPANIIRLDGSTVPWTFTTDLYTLPGVQANTWRLAPPEGGAVRITWSTAGGPFYVTFRMMIDEYTDAGTGDLYVSKANTPVWIKSMTGWPQGTLFSWRSGTDLAVVAGVGGSSVTSAADPNNAFRYGRLVAQAQEGNFAAYRTTMFFKIPAVTSPGTYEVSIKFDQSNGNTTSADVNAKTFTIPINVETITPLSGPSLTPADFTAVPGIAEWEDLMTNSDNYGGAYQGGSNLDNVRCPGTRSSITQVGIDKGDIGFSSQEQRGWFYDEDRHYQKTADYLRVVKKMPDDTWKNCAEYTAWDMTQDYKANLAPPGYRYRMRGIYIMSGQGKLDRNLYTDVIRYHGHVGVAARGETFDFNMRETALSFERRLQRYLKEGRPDHILEAQADTLVGWMKMWGNRDDYPSRMFAQPFMVGMVLRGLTWYYAVYHQDPRIPVVMKEYADAVWSWYNPATKQVLYNPEPIGPRCGNRCQQGIESTENNFVAPTFWFVWRLLGDNTYRDRGDELFGNATHDRRPGTGKEWGQFFYFAWDGICWRTGRCSTTTPQY